MSTEEKQEWTEERIREEVEREVREVLENWFDDELFQKIREWIDENKWVDDELLRKKTEWRLRDLWKRDVVKFYEERGFWLGREHQLLEELVEWLSRKEKEWKEVWRRIENKVWLKVKERNPNMSHCELWDEYWDKFRPSQVDECRHKFPWLVKEWNRYLETKELMLRKTRSKDLAKAIMSFC